MEDGPEPIRAIVEDAAQTPEAHLSPVKNPCTCEAPEGWPHMDTCRTKYP